ncbi:MAG: TSUP family transporter [Coriobacteriia bacterium]|nr:TSUP family transporter [Coriobacteriia bacterium]
MICPLCFLGGFVDSIAGGGGLITLPAFLAVGLPSHIAIGTNKIQSTLGTLVSTIRYFRQGYVDLKIGIACAVMAIIGSAIGSNLVLIVDDWTLKIVLIILLPITAFFVLWNKGMSKKRKEYGFTKTIIIAAVVAFFIGTYDGFYGPGTGTFLILLLTIIGHMSLENANGISKAANLASNIAAAVVFLINGVPLIVLGLTAGLFNAAGNFFGSKLFIDKGIKVVKPIMIVVLILLFAKVLFDMFA